MKSLTEKLIEISDGLYDYATCGDKKAFRYSLERLDKLIKELKKEGKSEKEETKNAKGVEGAERDSAGKT